MLEMEFHELKPETRLSTLICLAGAPYACSPSSLLLSLLLPSLLSSVAAAHCALSSSLSHRTFPPASLSRTQSPPPTEAGKSELGLLYGRCSTGNSDSR